MNAEAAGLVTPLQRRGFLMSSVISGLTLATARVEARAIHTSAEGLHEAEIQIPVSDGNLPGYAARPDKPGTFPIVLVVEEVFGVHGWIQDVCRRLAHAGYLAVAAEYYAREGNLTEATSGAQAMAVVSKAPDAQMMRDMDSALVWATENAGDSRRIGITGFCRGGRQTILYAAHNPHLRAAVAWYGVLDGATTELQPRTALEVLDEVQCPLLGLYGGADTLNPMALIEQAEAEAKHAKEPIEFVVYPGAPHGFAADYRPSYRQAAAEDGWQRMLAWFRKYGLA
ncbi:MAG TPA: dienelactone hydrolase family protein [Acetobacteraceae bacterium]|nr:dienelactone hydrolase family protein [Acetobacteraceae bacterium]